MKIAQTLPDSDISPIVHGKHYFSLIVESDLSRQSWHFLETSGKPRLNDAAASLSLL